MKKLIGFITLIVLAVFLTACGEDETTRTFEAEQNGIETTLEYTAKGDKVTKQTTENVIQYDLAGIESKEQAQELFDPMIEQFQNIEGITHKLEYEDSKAIESLVIDYEAVDFDEIMGLPGMNFSEDPKNNGISMEKSAEMLESQGFKEVK
ncbi:MAG: DUF1307 domain-containing protein [Psychrobacillus psychrodurans]